MTINIIKNSFFYLVGAKFSGLMGAETLKFPECLLDYLIGLRLYCLPFS